MMMSGRSSLTSSVARATFCASGWFTLPKFEKLSIATRGSMPKWPFTVSAERIAISARSSAVLLSTFTAVSARKTVLSLNISANSAATRFTPFFLFSSCSAGRMVSGIVLGDAGDHGVGLAHAHQLRRHVIRVAQQLARLALA